MAQAPDLGFIHRYLPAAGASRPPLLLLHGTGADENDLIPLGEMLAPGAAHDPSILAGALLMRASLPFDPRPLPDLAGFPVLLLSGKDDPLVPADRPPYFAALLGEAGASVTLELLPAGHALTQQDLVFAHAWLARFAAPQA